jgi:hypothetical protein
MNLTKATSFDPKTLAKTGFQTADKILAFWGSKVMTASPKFSFAHCPSLLLALQHPHGYPT